MDLNWEKYFLPYILERGRKYVREHRVETITRTKQGYEVAVLGQEKYHVEIRIAGDAIEQMNCDCFYVRNKGEHCKHMAAVLYELEAKEEQEEKVRKDQLPELEEMIRKMEKEEMQRFLVKTTQDFSVFDQELRIFLSGHVNGTELLRRKKEIDHIFLEHKDDYGFMDVQNAWQFGSEIQMFFQNKIQKMIEYGNEKAAFVLISHMIDQMNKTEIDDSDGMRSSVSDCCLFYIDKILKEGDRETAREIYKWFEECLSGEFPEDLREKWYDFVMGHFEEILFLEKKMALLDEKIEKEEQAKDEWKRRKWRENVAKRLQIMDQLSYPKEECERYKEKFWNVPEIRQMEIQKKIQQQEYENAEKMIVKSCKLDQNLLECQERYCRWLADLYQLQGRKKEYQEKMIEYFICYHQDSMELWRKIRSTFGEAEWLKVREKILQNVHSSYLRCQIMAEEKMFLTLIEELRKEKHLDDLDQYEKVLRRKFPKEMLQLYADCLVYMAQETKGREKYKEMTAHLKKMKKYPGGAQAVEQIVADWKKRYRKRSALMEELERLE